MAFSTTITRDARVEPQNGRFNVKIASGTGVVAGGVATMDTNIGLLIIKELPNNTWRFLVTSRPSAPGKMLFQAGATITG